MFFGHLGVGFGAKAVAPRVSIGVLLVAATAIDVLAGLFIAIGLEGAPTESGAGPWSHGLFMAGVWTLAAFALLFAVTRDRRSALVVGLLVASHWVLDFISHPMGMGTPLPPDLPLLFEGSPKVGLGLYNSVVAALVTDFGLFAAGVAVYLAKTRPLDRTGTIAFWVMIAAILASPFIMLLGPVGSVLACFTPLVLLPLGIWAERHRRLVASRSPAPAAKSGV